MISKNRIKYVRSLEMKKYRKAEGVFVAEGHKLVGDLLGAFPCVYVAATQEWMDSHAHELKEVEMDIVTDEELRRVSLMETPQQVLAVFRQRIDEVDVNRVVGEVTVRLFIRVAAWPLLRKVAVTVVVLPGSRLGLEGVKEKVSTGARMVRRIVLAAGSVLPVHEVLVARSTELLSTASSAT